MVGAAVSLPALSGATYAQQVARPGPIKFISSQAAGGGTDVIGRVVADQLSSRVGQPVVYENRPGGGNVIGTRSRGAFGAGRLHFLLRDRGGAGGRSLHVQVAAIRSDQGLHGDFADRGGQLHGGGASETCRPNNLAELFAYAKANPDKVAVATDGARRFSGMVAAWLNKLAGTNISYVPYTQMTQAFRMCSPAASSSSSLPSPAAKGHVAAGKLRRARGDLAQTIAGVSGRPGGRRDLPGFDFAGWFALAAPTGVPPSIIERVHKELNAILQDPAVSGKLKTMGFVPYGGGTLKDTRPTCRPNTRPGPRWCTRSDCEPE